MVSDISSDYKSQIAPDRLPPLGALRCFEAAARRESFSLAAADLHLTHGAISRAVRAIEADVGVALFERRNRRVYLTDAGRLLHQATAEAFGVIHSATRRLRRDAQQRPLVLSCEPTLLMRWLIPRLPQFATAYPSLSLRLVAGAGAVVFGEGIDLAIRRNDHPVRPGTSAEVLFDERVGPVCAPAQQARFFESDRVRADAARLHTHTRPEAWAAWAQRAGIPLPLGPEATFEHFYLSLQAAVAGLGVAIGPYRLVCDDLATGLLVAPLGFSPDGTHYHLITPRPIYAGTPEALLLAWLRQV
jgi:LysR family transcriptional regulator, glycine cleavage system transcriptional activator